MLGENLQRCWEISADRWIGRRWEAITWRWVVVVGSEAEFNLWLVGMRSGCAHPRMKSSILRTDEVQQGVEGMR